MNRYPDRGMHGRVVDRVGQRILTGDLLADASLDPDEIAADFDVSRTVVREALRVLAGKGLIDARPRRGTFVTERSRWNLLDPDVLRWQFSTITDPSTSDKLHEVRVMVEPAAAELAAMRRSDDDVSELFDAVEAMSSPDASVEAISEADLRFHLGILTATHNELVQQLSVVIGIGLSARDQFVHSQEVSISRGLDMHRHIAEAIRENDAAAARARMMVLLESAATDVRGLHLDQPHPVA